MMRETVHPEAVPEPRELPAEPDRYKEQVARWEVDHGGPANEPVIVLRAWLKDSPKAGPADVEIRHTLAQATQLAQGLIKGVRGVRDSWKRQRLEAGVWLEEK